MGDMADRILEGLDCEGCGEVIDGEAPGYPRRCSGCAGQDGDEDEDEDIED